MVAVGSTGRVGADGSLSLTGGGDIDIRIAGALNPNLTLSDVGEKHALAGALVDLRGALHVTQELLPLMARGSSIVFIGSIAAQRGGGLLGGPHYAASKGGILALAKSLARELGPAGIRVNAVNPGVIHTAMTENAYDADLRASVTASIPLGRFGTPDDVAGACLFLASGLSGYITGAEIDVNGGQHIH